MRSRRRLSSTAFMTCTRDMPESLGPGPMGLKNLVAITWSRRASLKGAAEVLLREAPGVGVGRVEEVHAPVDGQVHNAARLLLVGAVAEGHGAQADLGELEAGAAHAVVFHGP